MDLTLFCCWIFTCCFVVGDLRWNKFVNPFYNRTRNLRSLRQTKSLAWSPDYDNQKWSTVLNRMKPNYSPQRVPRFDRTLMNTMQMDSRENLFRRPVYTKDGRLAPIDRAYWDSPAVEFEAQPNPDPPLMASPSGKMIWNEHGQYWGYAPQSDSSDMTKEQLGWNYGSQEQFVADDGECIPPFCIPIDCDGNRKCRNQRNPSTSDCVGPQCCLTPQSCPPNDLACPQGYFGPSCAVLNPSTCSQRFSLDCLFGCTKLGSGDGIPRCICAPNLSHGERNRTACIPMSLEVFACPLGCSGHGQCDPHTKRCSCDSGYTGSGCELKDSCPPGMTGPACTMDIDECLSGASGCDQLCINTFGSYRCDCRDGYRIDPNDPRRCIRNLECEKNCVPGQGTCNNEYQCVCLPGFQGKWCADDIDECLQRIHHCEHICVNTHGSYECRCHPGYKINLLDPRRCDAVGCDPPCIPTQGICSSEGRCVCKPGFTGPDCGQDIDECSTGKHQCAQICVNTPGSFYCTCRPGFKPDRNYPNGCLREFCDPACLDERGECIGRSCNNGVCRTRFMNGTATKHCECHQGYKGERCERDVDECATGTHQCEQLCYNTPGSYVCACRRGYTLSSDKRTCELSTCGGGCLNGGKCQPNGRCQCPPKFGGNRCQHNVDQCKEIQGCEQLCLTDEDGEFRCACLAGYQLSSDGKSCVISQSCDPPCLNGAQCFRGRCLCKTGFEGHQCEKDKDECQLPAAVHGCPFACVNTYGSYECQCPPGYHRLRDRKTCVRSPTGVSCDPPCQNGAVCRPNNQCECLRGYRGPDCSQDIDECLELLPCDPKYGSCVNTPGGFECSCQPGYRLMVDGRHCIDENRAQHAPHLVFRGRGQKGIVLASPRNDTSTALRFEPRNQPRRRRSTLRASKYINDLQNLRWRSAYKTAQFRRSLPNLRKNRRSSKWIIRKY